MLVGTALVVTRVGGLIVFLQLSCSCDTKTADTLFTEVTELLVLSVLSERPLHGYALMDALRDRSGGAFDFAEGTLYPVLHRLERGGLLASRWDDRTRRRRRVYRLTSAGRRALVDQRKSWEDFADTVKLVVEGAR